MRTSVVISLLLLLGQALGAQTFDIASPDGRQTARIEVTAENGRTRITYATAFDGRAVVLPSALDLTVDNHVWEMATGKRSVPRLDRWFEVLLNYAEAVYEQGESISDADLDLSLNLVRQRSNPDMVKLSNSLVSANGLSMREEIRAERTVELALEGFRVDDLKRWKTAETEMPQNLRGIPMTGWFATNWTNQTRPLDADGCIILYDGRVWAEKNYLYPIPSDELQLNPELGQNKGWN